MLLGTERNELECFTSVLNNNELEEKDTNDDEYEEIIEEEVREDIELCLLQFPGIEEVEDLQEDEHIEEESKMLSIFFIPRFKLIV